MKTPAQISKELDSLTPQQRKTFEDRVRRAAQRQGLTLTKSRTRDPNALTYDGYMLLDARGKAEYGWSKSHGPGFEAALPMVAAYVLHGWR
jgi:hypothetical protein